MLADLRVAAFVQFQRFAGIQDGIAGVWAWLWIEKAGEPGADATEKGHTGIDEKRAGISKENARPPQNSARHPTSNRRAIRRTLLACACYTSFDLYALPYLIHILLVPTINPRILDFHIPRIEPVYRPYHPSCPYGPLGCRDLQKALRYTAAS
ncbi:MAG: hypothetical protein JW395_3724 [Nitrospira sp.]|nr:hypothetical protein [Nitrospira sp.]